MCKDDDLKHSKSKKSCNWTVTSDYQAHVPCTSWHRVTNQHQAVWCWRTPRTCEEQTWCARSKLDWSTRKTHHDVGSWHDVTMYKGLTSDSHLLHGWSHQIISRKYRNLIIWTTQKQKVPSWGLIQFVSSNVKLKMVIGMQIELDGGEILCQQVHLQLDKNLTTVEDFELHSDDYFESYLLGIGLYVLKKKKRVDDAEPCWSFCDFKTVNLPFVFPDLSYWNPWDFLSFFSWCLDLLHPVKFTLELRVFYEYHCRGCWLVANIRLFFAISSCVSETIIFEKHWWNLEREYFFSSLWASEMLRTSSLCMIDVAFIASHEMI